MAKAKAVVQEPPQPKIKLKIPLGSETPAPSAKRITIHVKDTKSSGAPSPAPQTGQSSDSSRADGGQDINRSFPLPAANTPGGPLQHLQLEKARSFSTPGASPTPPFVGVRQEGSAQPSPAMIPRVNGAVALNGQNGIGPIGQNTPQLPIGAPVQNGHPPAPPPPPPIYDKKFRAAGRGESKQDSIYIYIEVGLLT